MRLDDRPKTWYGYEESNPNLNVRSVPSCPLNDTRVKVWLAAQASNPEPSESESDALPIAPAASGCGPRNGTSKAGFKGRRLAVNRARNKNGVTGEN